MEDKNSFKTGLPGQSRSRTSADASLSQPAQHQINLRSCLTCHQRKIRCDKQSPCATCVRTNVLCCYPDIEHNRRRPQKNTINEISARLARLERTITSLTKGAATLDIGQMSTPDKLASHSEVDFNQSPAAGSSPEELLVQDGDSSRYINEVILSRILDKVRAAICPRNETANSMYRQERELQAIMRSPSVDKGLATTAWSSDLGGIFHDFNLSTTGLQSCFPSRWHALQLWQIFVNNVDPITKILHIPTAQATIFNAINNPGSAEANLNALLFAIYFAALTSLSPADAFNLLGQDRSKILIKFKQGLEHSLAAANLFDSPSMLSLQAMGIYIVCRSAFSLVHSS